LALAISGVAADDPIFDVAALSSTPLNAKTLKTTERDGVITEEIQYHSETDGEKEVEIFAYFSYPKGASRLPAFIWNPGGLGQANPGYTEVPARRGYAVLCIDFPQPGYRSTGNYPINSGLELGDDPKKAPIYHGAVALLKAVSYLQSRPEVDKDRIGMAGASWGGFFTTLMVGVDSRLKVGSCLYGTGSLQLGNAWWDGVSQNGRDVPTPEQRARWSVTLDPAWRLSTRKTPIAWFTTTNDAFYSMPAMMKTISLCAGPTHLSLLPNWDHAMPPKYHNEHVYDWLDVYLRGKTALTKVSPVAVRRDGQSLVAEWEFTGDAKTADVIVSFGESGNWRHRYWFTSPGVIDGNKCRANLPAGNLPCFVGGAIVAANGIRSSTPLVRIDPRELGLDDILSPCPFYDGCCEWGGFEEEQIAFLKQHNNCGQVRWLPKLSPDAKEGKYSAILNADRTILPQILSTANVPHQLSCFMKADHPTTVTVQLNGESREFSIGTEWTNVTMNLTPVNSVMGSIGASIVTPAETRVLVDAISFSPVLAVSR
jgi:dienelactone hydrolase